MTADDEGQVTSVGVFMADGSRMGCQLMAAALRRSRYHLEVVGSSTDSSGVRIAFAKSKRSIDILLTSSQLADGPLAGLAVAREIAHSHPKVGIIILLDSSQRAVVVEAFRAGASGILSREQPFDIVCKCIHSVYQGQVWASAKEIRYALDALKHSDPTESASPKHGNGRALLTKREESVVHLVAEGLTNRDISRHLQLSENTVRNYLFRIFNKVGTSNRLELALYVINRKQPAARERSGVSQGLQDVSS